MGDLTKNFSLDEFTASDTADKLGIDNIPDPYHLVNIKRHAEVMQLIRNLIGRSISITSGYRNPAVNKAVGGVPHGDHPMGDASDSRAAGLSAYAYARIIESHMRPGGVLAGKIDQLILETSRNIVHVSTAPRLRAQVLTQRGGAGTPFELGLKP
jgi:zinc D-Ala-D-Ala carboxypeptidase